MSLNAKILLAATILGFAILHIVGGAMLQDVSGSPPIESAGPMHHGD
jgi:hypothetical protein